MTNCVHYVRKVDKTSKMDDMNYEENGQFQTKFKIHGVNWINITPEPMRASLSIASTHATLHAIQYTKSPYQSLWLGTDFDKKITKVLFWCDFDMQNTPVPKDFMNFSYSALFTRWTTYNNLSGCCHSNSVNSVCQPIVASLDHA